jgi:hypothetical protein
MGQLTRPGPADKLVCVKGHYLSLYANELERV